MTYYEGIDYFVRTIEFPNMASAGVSVSNGDGTYTIFINALFCDHMQLSALEHEVTHLVANHFYREDDIATLEDEARSRFATSVADELFYRLDVVGLQ